MFEFRNNRNHRFQLVTILLTVLCSAAAFAQIAETENTKSSLAPKPAEVSGIKFSCSEKELTKINRDMRTYFRELGISTKLVSQVMPDKASLIYTLNTAPLDTNTLDFRLRKEYRIKDDILRLPIKSGGSRAVKTVSKKEILLTLLQHGRLTSLNGAACTIDALRDHVAIRQNIVAWTDNLAWGWPDGERAFWNTTYWDSGTPLNKVSLDMPCLILFYSKKNTA